MKNKYTIEELESLVFEKNQATKQNKDKLFKLAKAKDNLRIIEKLADEFQFKNAKNYLIKLNNISLDEVLKSKDTKLLQVLNTKGIDVSHLNIADLIINKYSYEFIETVIVYGGDVNKMNKEGYLPLTESSFRGYEEITLLLLKHGANPNKVNNETANPLIVAAQQGHYSIVELLLNYGANINYQTDIGVTALIQASVIGHEDVFLLLIHKGANINLVNHEGATALLMAAQQNHFKIAKILIDAGADINIKTNNGSNVLTIPSQEGLTEIIELFIEHNIDLNIEDNDGDTGLLLASKNGHKKIVELFINNNVDIDHTNKNGDSSLILASRSSEMEIVELLLESSANPNLEAKDKSTALSFAFLNGNKALIHLLIKFGAFKLPNKINVNELWNSICATRGIEAAALANVLIKNDADINYQKLPDSNTPILNSVGYDNLEVAKTLIKYGANLDLQNTGGFTALHVAVMNKNVDLVKVLLEANTDPDIQTYENNTTPLFMGIGHRVNINDITACTSNIKKKNDITVQIVKLLLKYKADPNILNTNGTSPLMVASRIGDIEMVNLLLKAKARMDIQENTGLTALMSASHANHLEICKTLLDHAADVNYISTNNRSTALSEAITNNNLEIVKLLILEGSDPYHESQATINGTPFGVHPNDMRHGNALQLAEEFSFKGIEQFLKNHMKTMEENNEIPKGHIVLQHNLSIDVYSKYIILKSKAGDEKSEIIYNKVDRNKYKNDKKGYFYIDSINNAKKETLAGDIREYVIESHTGNILELNYSHNPKALSSLLKKFSSDERLKYTNHSWDVDEFYNGQSLNYEKFMEYLEKGWDEINADLKKSSSKLYEKINGFLFSADAEYIGFSSIQIKKALQQGEKPESIFLEDGKTLQDKMNDFKGLIVVKQNDKRLKLLKIFIELKKQLKLSIKLNLDDLKEDKVDKFFTDVDRLKKGLKIMLTDIDENADENTKDVIIQAQEVDDVIEIKIIHRSSSSSKTAEQLSETINDNGGNFKTIYDNFRSVCDWSIDTICQDGIEDEKSRYQIDYLYPEVDNNKPHYRRIDDTIEGFTHILRFYK